MAKKPTILAKGPKTCTFMNFQTKPLKIGLLGFLGEEMIETCAELTFLFKLA